VYVKYSYDDFHFTTSTQTAAFGDFPWRGEPQHWSVPQFLEYLDEYIAHFGFKQHMRFNAKVEKVTQTTTAAGTKVWRLMVHYKKWNHRSEFPLTMEASTMDLQERREVYTCDHIVAATGTHNKWQLPKIPGRKQCAGRHYHSSEFHRLARSGELAGRHVLLVGLGESGCDLAKLAAAAVALPPGGGAVSVSVPRHSGVYFPREFEGSPADTLDSRLLYGSARWPTHLVVRHTFRRRFLRHSYDKDAMAAAAAANYQSQRTAMNSFGVKTLDLFNAAATCSNVRMVPAAVKAFEADGTAVFSDGTKLLPDVVIFCTG
jgi:cation diffusion facilitator CzcD-associated flavoprotein CzcO